MVPSDFIRGNTELIAAPLVPEIRLHLAAESLPIWRKTEEELGQMNVPPPYWAFAWAGGQALARYLLDNRGLVAGRRVLDLGAGSGIVSIAAMLAGARWVVAADIDTLALAAIGLNADATALYGLEACTETSQRFVRLEPSGAARVGACVTTKADPRYAFFTAIPNRDGVLVDTLAGAYQIYP